jgi:hypothetical protein
MLRTGLWGAVLGMLFGVTGILLNHRANHLLENGKRRAEKAVNAVSVAREQTLQIGYSSSLTELPWYSGWDSLSLFDLNV